MSPLQRKRSSPWLIFPILLIHGLIFPPAPAPAWDSPVISQAAASLTFQLFTDPSPTPICWLVWEEVAEVLHGQALPIQRDHSEDGEPCASAWLVRCDGEGLFYEGSWPEIDPDAWYWTLQAFTAELVVQLSILDTTRLLAERRVVGLLEIDEHLVTLAPIPGDEIEILGVDTEDTAKILLEPGAYILTLYVYAREWRSHYAYEGAVGVWWEDPELVPNERSSWGAVKELYD